MRRVEAGVHDTPTSVEVSIEQGIVGDRWFDGKRQTHSQITLMNVHIARMLCQGSRRPLHQSGDNLLVDLDLSESALPVGTRLRIGIVLLEVTAEPHNGCGKFANRFGTDALKWLNEKDHRTERRRGLHAKVLEPGTLTVGQRIVVED